MNVAGVVTVSSTWALHYLADRTAVRRVLDALAEVRGVGGLEVHAAARLVPLLGDLGVAVTTGRHDPARPRLVVDACLPLVRAGTLQRCLDSAGARGHARGVRLFPGPGGVVDGVVVRLEDDDTGRPPVVPLSFAESLDLRDVAQRAAAEALVAAGLA